MTRDFAKNFLLALIVLSLPMVVFGAESIDIGNPLKTTDVQELLNNVIDAILGIVGVVAVAMIVYGGVQIMISGGDSKKLEDAKKTITSAIIGLIIALLSYAIINYVLEIFNK